LEVFSTGWWLGGAHHVVANGVYQVCRGPYGPKITKAEIGLTWYDGIDGLSMFGEENVRDQGLRGVSDLEGLYDIISDKLLNADFAVRIAFKYTFPEN
jgi:hypothetical protein